MTYRAWRLPAIAMTEGRGELTSNMESATICKSHSPFSTHSFIVGAPRPYYGVVVALHAVCSLVDTSQRSARHPSRFLVTRTGWSGNALCSRRLGLRAKTSSSNPVNGAHCRRVRRIEPDANARCAHVGDWTGQQRRRARSGFLRSMWRQNTDRQYSGDGHRWSRWRNVDDDRPTRAIQFASSSRDLPPAVHKSVVPHAGHKSPHDDRSGSDGFSNRSFAEAVDGLRRRHRWFGDSRVGRNGFPNRLREGSARAVERRVERHRRPLLAGLYIKRFIRVAFCDERRIWAGLSGKDDEMLFGSTRQRERQRPIGRKDFKPQIDRGVVAEGGRYIHATRSRDVGRRQDHRPGGDPWDQRHQSGQIRSSRLWSDESRSRNPHMVVSRPILLVRALQRARDVAGGRHERLATRRVEIDRVSGQRSLSRWRRHHTQKRAPFHRAHQPTMRWPILHGVCDSRYPWWR